MTNKKQELADQEADHILTNEVFPSYLFRKGEKMGSCR